ncbi:hypothetical protein Tco_0583335 [Tanacetum coccineum]
MYHLVPNSMTHDRHYPVRAKETTKHVLLVCSSDDQCVTSSQVVDHPTKGKKMDEEPKQKLRKLEDANQRAKTLDDLIASYSEMIVEVQNESQESVDLISDLQKNHTKLLNAFTGEEIKNQEIKAEIKALTIELDKARHALKPFNEDLFTHRTELLAESQAKDIISRKIASLDLPLDDDGSIYLHHLLAESQNAIQIEEQHIMHLTETMKPFNHKVSDLESKVKNAADRLQKNRDRMSDIMNEVDQTDRQIDQYRLRVESRDAMLVMLEKWLQKSEKEKLEVTTCLDCASSRHYPVDVELLS